MDVRRMFCSSRVASKLKVMATPAVVSAKPVLCSSAAVHEG